MNIDEHVPTCLHCKSTDVTDVEHTTRSISIGMWQPEEADRSIPRVSFRCVSCGKPNEYDIPES